MKLQENPIESRSNKHHEKPSLDKHFVFRSGQFWFSIPALSVREIIIAPTMVSVPGCDLWLDGLCHLRSEFVPVVSLFALLEMKRPLEFQPKKLVVIEGSNRWGLQVSEAATLTSLETIIAPNARADEAGRSIVLGTATYGEQVVRVLDPLAAYAAAGHAIDRLIQNSSQHSSPVHCQ